MSSKFSFHDSIIELLKPLRKVAKFFDVKLRCIGGESIPAHRIILAMHSGLFADLLNDDQEFKIGIDIHKIELIVELMYTGSVNVLDNQRQSFVELIELFDIRNCTEHFNDRVMSYGEFLPHAESSRHVSQDLDQTERNARLELFNTRLSEIISHSEGLTGENDDSTEEGAIGGNDVPDDEANGTVEDIATAPTSAEEIVENLFEFSSEAASYKVKKYSLRYWMAVMLARFGKVKITHAFLNDKLGIDRSTIQNYIAHSPVDHGYGVPGHKKNLDPTSAEALIRSLYQTNEWPVMNDQTYALRFWMAQAIYKWKPLKRSLRELEALFGVSRSKISRGTSNSQTPEDVGYCHALDRRP